VSIRGEGLARKPKEQQVFQVTLVTDKKLPEACRGKSLGSQG